ncbi:MAG TPA: NAD(P)-dependent oxidoreductase [Gemmataceae bacterium]|nr:NAD(P)-dependent oxidoreductase [Gemmataceae bacterium]
MKVFVAGATGAIGRPLIAALIRQGHTVTGMTHSETGAHALHELGVAVAQVSAFDAAAVAAAVRASRAEVIIDELPALPKSPADMPAAREGDRRLRMEGGEHLRHAALTCGVRRYIQQSSGFFVAPGEGLADEAVGMAVDASPGVASHALTYAALEERLLAPGPLEGVSLRYGFFYGPNTWYHPDGACGEMVRRQEIPIIGKGNAVWSWVHIEDAASATVTALTAPPGIYNVVDDDPSAVNVWLPAFARLAGAPTPPYITEDQARIACGEDAVYYGTRLRGASNAKAKKFLGFAPRRLEWLQARS